MKGITLFPAKNSYWKCDCLLLMEIKYHIGCSLVNISLAFLRM